MEAIEASILLPATITFLVVCCLPCLSAHGEHKVLPDNNRVNVCAIGSLSNVFTAAPSVYIGTVARHQATSPAGALIEYGSLMFDVDETLRGPVVKHLSLPYSRANRFVKSDFNQIWPDQVLLKGAKGCVFVVPKAYDATAPALDDAASNVFVAEPPDQSFTWVGKILAIEAISRDTHRPELLERLKQATVDENDHVFEYAFGTLSGGIFKLMPKEAADILFAALEAAKPERLKSTGMAQQVMHRLSDIARDTHSPIESRQAVIHILALLVADSPDQLLRSIALQHLAAAVAERSFSTPTLTVKLLADSTLSPKLKANDVLSAEELARFKKALKALSSDPNVEQAVSVDQRWADGHGGRAD